jgi:hypothetical protein
MSLAGPQISLPNYYIFSAATHSTSETNLIEPNYYAIADTSTSGGWSRKSSPTTSPIIQKDKNMRYAYVWRT